MDQNDALELWQRLGEEGKAPTDLIRATQSLPSYTVGFDPWVDRLAARYLGGLCRRSAHFKLALAPYGGGKTHFLMSLGIEAWRKNFAVSYVPCSSEVSLDNPLEVYRATVKYLRLPNRDEPGLQSLVDATVEAKRNEIARHSVPNPAAALTQWIHTLSRRSFPENAFGRVMAAALDAASGDGVSPVGDAAERWLQGDANTLTRDELAELRLAKPRAADSARLGRDLLLSLAKFLPETGAYGLTLLLDEVENLFQIRSGKAKNKLLAAMRILLDAPTGVPGGLPLFGVFSATPDVLEDLRQYPALEQRLAVRGAPFGQGNDLAVQLPLEDVQGQEDLLEGIGARLIAVGSLALDLEFDVDLQRRNARQLARVASKRSMEVDARRIFVKTWVGLLEFQASTHQRAFEEGELAGRYSGSFDSLVQAEEAEFEA